MHGNRRLTKKSKTSVRVMAAAMSLRCSVRRLFSSECDHDRSVSSKMNISHACVQVTAHRWLVCRLEHRWALLVMHAARRTPYSQTM